MSWSWQARITRRRAIAGTVAALGIAALGGIAHTARRVAQCAASVPFDDLLARLPERDRARRIGMVVLRDDRDFDAQRTARDLRQHLGGRALPTVLAGELISDRLVEVDGWVVPETLASLCALAAAEAP